jgi:AcrR family transcriptional regulator
LSVQIIFTLFALSIAQNMNKLGVQERILHTASKLFYAQGYNLTGVNQIIAEAGVAKASLFQYYPTKEDLCVAYLAAKNSHWMEAFLAYVKKSRKSQSEAVIAFDYLKENAPKENFRGCSFLNILSEVPADNVKILAQVHLNKSILRTQFKNWLKEAGKPQFADFAYLLFEGAIIESQVQKDVWPITAAKNALIQLVE